MILNRVHIAKWLDALRSSYWFLPGLMVIGGVGLSVALVGIERVGWIPVEALPEWLRIKEPSAARSVLTTVAGAMITIVSLTFSISIVSLTLASSQFGSRLLYNFMRDRSNQAVLGFFLGTFVYCIVALSSVTFSVDQSTQELALAGALALALSSAGVLIYFIHHVAESIQATNVISNVGSELRELIDRSLPECGDGPPIGADEADDSASAAFGDDSAAPTSGHEGLPVLAQSGGTVQAVDGDALLALAVAHDFEVQILPRPGDYILEGAELARVRGAATLETALECGVRDSIVVGNRRTLLQDLEFAFHQLVEIAVRALSPGVNDPFTAMSCIDELGTGLARVAQRGPMPRRLVDDDGRARVFLDTTDFDGIAGAAFDQIRQHGASDVAVSLHLLGALRRLMPLMRTARQRATLLRQGRLAHELASGATSSETDRRTLRARFDELEATHGSCDAHADR